ncbi:MAG: type IX secretion system sortase PorU [Flavobacteriales bacterium]|nr:type IX secretion system sortase PorU [Flavobacteriales bacterium]
MSGCSILRIFWIALLSMSFQYILGQELSIDLDWSSGLSAERDTDASIPDIWFQGAHQSDIHPELPEFGAIVPIPFDSETSGIQLRNPRIEEIVLPASLAQMIENEEFRSEVQAFQSRGQAQARLRIFPFRKRFDGKIERLLGADIRLNTTKKTTTSQTKTFVQQSKLATGDWYRIPISRDGIYRLDRDYFQGLGVDVNGIDPNDINIYGNDQGLLPYNNSEFRYDDLQVKAVEFVGGGDGSFDSGDYILFYAKGPHRWEYDDSDEEFKHVKHLYMDVAYNFIGIGIEAPVRIGVGTQPTGTAQEVVTTFDDHSFHEEDLENVIKSGRRMVGEQFGLSGQLNFSGSEFSFENVDTQSSAKVRMRGVARTVGASVFSEMSYTCQGNTESFTLQGTSPTSYTITRSKERVLEFIPTSGNLAISTTFSPGGTDADGWVDFFSINVRRRLERTSSQLHFRDARSWQSADVVEFQISDVQGSDRLWRVTESISPEIWEYDLVSDMASFKTDTDDLHEFVLFNPSNALSPGTGQAVANQDLHSSPQYDMVIVSAVPFLATAEKVADVHREEGLSVFVVEPQTIYNEFSCGMQDITAIKMFMKMLYDRADADPTSFPDYLLLIGDGNYDNTDIDPRNSIYLPTYQSAESNSLTQSFVSDDYFGLLDDDEGEIGGTVDIGIGRFPVRSVDEAEAIYAKIIRYKSRSTGVVNGVCAEEASTPFGDWKNRVLLIGDDEDSNTHMSQANTLGNILESVDEDYIIDKIFLDAYLQETTPGGDRYPQAAEELRRSIERGVFLASYTGHGGEVGWAAERILDVPTIQSLTNANNLPLLLTATCEFSRFDDPGRTSAGEFILLNPEGGVIALLTTTRLVYANPNFILSQNFFDVVMRSDQDSYVCSSAGGDFTMDLPNGLRLGDIIRISKNCTVGNEVNKANFSLLGDPALQLSYPELDIFIHPDSITDSQGLPLDTVKALQKVRVSGEVRQNGALATDFQGVVEPSVYDKEVTIQTLSNDGGNPYSFSLRQNIIYKGRASVKDGRFQFEFVVPKDISYQEGAGKLHLYALSDDTDAQGSRSGFQVGGTDLNAPQDEAGPGIDLFLNSEAFVDGGLTNESPTLIAKVFDDNGINTVGNGIGHDITAVLDGNTADPIVLNDYYESDLDSYQSGQVRYTLDGLSEGEHTLTFKVWDIYNNSSTKEISFIVEKQEDLVLDNVLNYPNPFTTRTEFLFEHNQDCALLSVEIQIFTVSGRLVKTIQEVVDTHTGLRDRLVWDGRDDYGDELGRGVYVYRLKVSTPQGEKEEVFEKLVLL